MTIYLDRTAVMTAGSTACGIELRVGDEGLLQAAIARPQATAFGLDAYPTTWDKAAALLHSLANNHALLDATNAPPGRVPGSCSPSTTKCRFPPQPYSMSTPPNTSCSEPPTVPWTGRQSPPRCGNSRHDLRPDLSWEARSTR